MLLAEDAQRRRRRTVRARMAALTGVMAGAAACSASLVMALTHSSRAGQDVATAGVTSAPAPQEKKLVSATVTDTPPKVEATAPERPRRTVRRRRSRGRVRTARPTTPAVDVWTEQTVEYRMEGLLANAWIVEPQADGALQLAPAIIDLPVDALPTADACGPVGEEASTEPRVNEDAPAPPADGPK
jgi:hypothetical protein